jgi:hypothetical protein
MNSPLPAVDVVVTVIYHSEQVLLVFNPKWGAFTLPMTKLRQWPYGENPSPARSELPEDAAMRNVGECLGKTFLEGSQSLRQEIIELAQSDADSAAKRYLYRVFAFHALDTALAPGVAGEWLRINEILDEQRRPISKSARSLVRQLATDAKVHGDSFPPK